MLLPTHSFLPADRCHYVLTLITHLQLKWHHILCLKWQFGMQSHEVRKAEQHWVTTVEAGQMD